MWWKRPLELLLIFEEESRVLFVNEQILRDAPAQHASTRWLTEQTAIRVLPLMLMFTSDLLHDAVEFTNRAWLTLQTVLFHCFLVRLAHGHTPLATLWRAPITFFVEVRLAVSIKSFGSHRWLPYEATCRNEGDLRLVQSVLALVLGIFVLPLLEDVHLYLQVYIHFVHQII